MEIEIHANPTPWSKHISEKILEQRSLSFVILNSQIVGFCIANKVLDECHLQNISVLETMRRQGVGNFMLDILKKRMSLSGITTILLEARRSNKIAQDFYARTTFKNFQSGKIIIKQRMEEKMRL